jgi:hypothetical protein
MNRPPERDFRFQIYKPGLRLLIFDENSVSNPEPKLVIPSTSGSEYGPDTRTSKKKRHKFSVYGTQHAGLHVQQVVHV